MLQNIRKFITDHTFVFCIFAVLLIISVCSLLYSVSFANALFFQVVDNEEQRTFVLSVDGQNLEEKLRQLAQENDNLAHVYCKINNNGDTVVVHYLSYPANGEKVAYGRWFSQEEQQYGATKVVLPNYPMIFDEANPIKVVDIGEQYDIGGVSYQAIGIGLMGENYQILYNSLQDKSAIDTLCVTVTAIKNQQQTKDFGAYLEQLFGGKILQQPTTQGQMGFSRYATELMIIVAIMLVSLFNVAYLYLYLLQTRKKQIAIERISGQTVLKGVMTAYFEVVIISTVIYLISALLMQFCLLPIMNNLGVLVSASMSFLQYLAVFALFTLAYSLIFLPAIIWQIKKSPCENLTEVEG